MPTCTSCGKFVKEGDSFCRSCGYSLLIENNDKDQLDERVPPSNDQSNVSILGTTLGAFSTLFLPRRRLVEISDAAYEKLPPPRVAQSWKLTVLALILFAGFYLLEFGEQTLSIIDSNLMYFISTYAVAFLFLFWVYQSDRYEREPFMFVIYLFAWGVFCGIIAAPLNTIFAPYFQMLFGNGSLVAPFVEEPLKALGLFWLVRHKIWGKEFNSPLDGVVYGFAAGLGFFAMENFHYYLNFDESVLIFRSLLCWGHGVWVATTGLWLAIAKIQRGDVSILDIIPGLLVAITLHFLWNGWTSFLGPDTGFFVLLGQGIHQLWYSRKMIKEALRDDVLLGYGEGMAPIERY